MNVASVSGCARRPGTAAYGAAKAGLLNLTQTLAVEFAPKVRVNAVTPGLIATELAHLHYGDDEADRPGRGHRPDRPHGHARRRRRGVPVPRVTSRGLRQRRQPRAAWRRRAARVPGCRRPALAARGSDGESGPHRRRLVHRRGRRGGAARKPVHRMRHGVLPEGQLPRVATPTARGARFEEVRLATRGTIWSYTDARYQPPPPYETGDRSVRAVLPGGRRAGRRGAGRAGQVVAGRRRRRPRRRDAGRAGGRRALDDASTRCGSGAATA